jgi:hypothetical protein
VFSEVRSQRSEHNMWRACIKIRPLLEPARPGYALLFTLIPCLSRGLNIHSPPVLMRTMKGSPVVLIGVDRHGVGLDNGTHRAPERGGVLIRSKRRSRRIPTQGRA